MARSILDDRNLTDPLTRIKVARREVGQTEVGKATARWLVVGFLALIATIPVAQLIVDPSLYKTARNIFHAPSATTDQSRSVMKALLDRNQGLLASIDQLDDLITDNSFLATVIRPPVQSFLTMRLGAGTEHVHLGVTPWLFYGPDVSYVGGNGFLMPSELTRRTSGSDTFSVAPRPDPRPVILTLNQQLAREGIELIVMPTPVKPSIHPEHLTGAWETSPVVRNPSYQPFVEDLRSRDVSVFDVIAELEEAKRTTSNPLYLATDTHWRPEAVERVAARLASFIEQRIELPDRPPTAYEVRPMSVTNRGDTTRLLALPPTQAAYPAETVELRQITSPDGSLWQSDPHADILLLGDSFTNVFSLDQMGWGTGAGLAEQLSFALQRPVDRIARNDNGAYASREGLATELTQSHDRLAGKRVVIFQFANRELGHGDWRVVDFTLGSPLGLTSFLRPIPGQQLEVWGVVGEIGSVPRPRSVPYRDHIVGVHVTDIRVDESSAPIDTSDALVYLWSMQDDELTSAADLRTGDPIHLRLEPWSNVSDELDGINRGEVGTPSVRLAEPWWGQLMGTPP